MSQHHDSWAATGYATSTKLGDVFSGVGQYKLFGQPLSKYTMLNALNFPDEDPQTVDGAAQLLARAGVAAVLNAAHPDVSFGMTAAEVISAVNTALDSKDRQTMLALQSSLDAANNQGCPLN